MPQSLPKPSREEFLRQLGSRIRSLRIERGLTQEDFDDGSDYSITSRGIQEIEYGHKDVRAFTLNKIAVRLGVNIAALFEKS